MQKRIYHWQKKILFFLNIHKKINNKNLIFFLSQYFDKKSQQVDATIIFNCQ